MGDQHFKDAVDAVSKVIDGAGVVVIVVGLVIAAWLFFAQRDRSAAYRTFRQFRGVGVLAVVVAVRTFLSFTLDVELEGRWPWQERAG